MKINDYVRTKNGIIGKYIQPDLGKPYITNGISFNEGANYGKHNKDIMDLIECQDLLYIDISPDNCGGIVVPRIAETQEELNKIISNIKNGVWILKEIVTKEQIKSNAYFLEKER